MQTPTQKEIAKSLKTRLANYKKLQEKYAKSKGKYEELIAATTLTQARKILYGVKHKNCSGWRGWVIDNKMPGGRTK